MGGHLPFQATHNVFISAHGIYLLVFRLTDFLNDKQEADRLKKWIRMIGTFSAVEYNAPKLKEHHPPLIFVGTFLDELKENFPDYDRQIHAISSSISKFPELSPHKFVKFCTIDNTLGTKPDDQNLEKLRGFITDLAEHQDQWGRELPAKWLQLEMDLLKRRKEGSKIMTLKEVEEMNGKSIVPLHDVNEIKIALEYLHCTRSVIYFREIDSIIIDPQFLVDFFSILITDNEFLPKDDIKLLGDLELYSEEGAVTPALLDILLSQEKTKAFLPHKSNLLALMEKFGLIVRMPLLEGTTENVRFSETYTIPTKLAEMPNISSITDCVKDLAVSTTLCFLFKDVFVPEELFCRVFATIMRTFKTSSLLKQPLEEGNERNDGQTKEKTCLFRGFGCFEFNDFYSMILSMHWVRSTIAVTLFSPTKQELPQGSGRHVRERLEQILQETLQMSCQQHFQYTYKLHCNFHLNPYDTPLDLVSVSYAKEGLPCKGEECRGKHRLTKSDLLFWGIKEASTTTQRHTFDAGDARLDRRPTPRELGRLTYVVEANKCPALFTNLGLSTPDISNIEHEARNLGVETQITRMFLVWTCSYPNHTFRHIENAMKEADMDWDCLDMVLETGWESVTLDDMEANEELNRPLAVSETTGILSNIGKKYFNLFLELGLPATAIERCEIDHPTAEGRFKALIQLWIKTFQDRATIIRVLKAMKVCKMHWHDTALIYCGADHAAKTGKGAVSDCNTAGRV
ncbi:uncharacterized protein LOC117342711 [Pecten maximus]|uniref:uncharacterized protein LOC117342711 n=1 Tax=Pecten maximus TaxID=6579 RepID=UPI001458D3D4|nr:uncharacterized protein LOC117342711 [Pecten maximus]